MVVRELCCVCRVCTFSTSSLPITEMRPRRRREHQAKVPSDASATATLRVAPLPTTVNPTTPYHCTDTTHKTR